MWFDVMMAVVMTAALSAAMTAVLAWRGMRRPAVLSGVVVGCLLGPTLAGVLHSEELRARFFEGGVEERQALAEANEAYSRDIESMGQTGVSDAAMDEYRERQKAGLEATRSAVEEAVKIHGATFGAVASAIGFALLGYLIPRRIPRVTSAVLGESAFAVAWTNVIVVGVVGAAAVYLLDVSAWPAAAVGLTFAVTARPRPFDEPSVVGGADAERAAHLLAETIGVVGWVTAVAVVVAAMLMKPGDTGVGVSLTRVETIGAAGGFIVGIVSARISVRTRSRAARNLVAVVLLPMAAALLVSGVNWGTLAIVGPTAIGIIVGGDGRWLGLSSAIRMWGASAWCDRWSRAWGATMGNADAAAAQIATAAVLVSRGWVEGPLVAGIVIGAVACDLTTPLRPRLVAMMNPHDENSADDQSPGVDEGEDSAS